MTILDNIIACKRREVAALRDAGYYRRFENAVRTRSCSMSRALSESGTGIIAEFKRRSPSKGDIHPMAMVADIVPGYEAAGAAACSVLTDTPFFGGSVTDLAVARSCAALPLLRKEFIVHPCQITEAAAFGADAVLLIASVLTYGEICEFTETAHFYGMEVLLEIHGYDELGKIAATADMIGVNNRNLKNFHTDIAMASAIIADLPGEAVKVAESGLKTMDEIRALRSAGYRGFLIGETFMKAASPAEALSELLKQ